MPIRTIFPIIALLVAFAIVGAAFQTTIKRVEPKAVSPSDGKAMFMEYCATCHAADGRTHSKWEAGFKRLPTDLIDGPFYDLPGSGTREERMIRIAQMAKFGIPGSDMPGHEYLPDQQIASISLWVLQNIAHPVQNQ